MDFNDSARLDTSQVNDVRGRRGPGGKGLAVGGGGLGLVGLLIALVLGVNPADVTGGDGTESLDSGASTESTERLAQRCQTGADADKDETCRVVGTVNSIQKFWRGQVPGYRPATTNVFEGSVATGCGNATSAVGPFYCPPDDGIYLDLGFFEVLRTDYGAKGGDFAQAYVIAHEYGHHIQNITGQSAKVQRSRDQEGPQSGSVRLELQADCYGGAWAANAVSTGFLATLTDADISQGLSAAAAVGDDRIQQQSSGRVDPESWTHGSAEQRQKWFRTGLASGDPKNCDTFSIPAV